jgi:hypothetical protein
MNQPQFMGCLWLGNESTIPTIPYGWVGYVTLGESHMGCINVSEAWFRMVLIHPSIAFDFLG